MTEQQKVQALVVDSAWSRELDLDGHLDEMNELRMDDCLQSYLALSLDQMLALKKVSMTE